MKIRIEDIPEIGLELRFSGQENTLASALQAKAMPEGIRMSPQITGDLRISQHENRDFLLSGNIHVTAGVSCARCLSEFEVDEALDFELVVHVRGAEARLDDEENVSDADTILVDGPEIDIGEIIVQEALLELPMKPLCSEQCAGLCPTCGLPAGSRDCKCLEEEQIDPRWARLAQLKELFKE